MNNASGPTNACCCWLWTASTETSQVESSLYQKANERVQLGVLHTWPVSGDASAGTFALAAKYTPSQESSVKVRCISLGRLTYRFCQVLLTCTGIRELA